MKISRQRKNDIQDVLNKFLHDNVDYSQPATVGFALQKIVNETVFDFIAEINIMKKKTANVAFDGSELL